MKNIFEGMVLCREAAVDQPQPQRKASENK